MQEGSPLVYKLSRLSHTHYNALGFFLGCWDGEGHSLLCMVFLVVSEDCKAMVVFAVYAELKNMEAVEPIGFKPVPIADNKHVVVTTGLDCLPSWLILCCHQHAAHRNKWFIIWT